MWAASVWFASLAVATTPISSSTNQTCCGSIAGTSMWSVSGFPMRSQPLMYAGRSAEVGASDICCQMLWFSIFKSATSTVLRVSKKMPMWFSHPFRDTLAPPPAERFTAAVAKQKCELFTLSAVGLLWFIYASISAYSTQLSPLMVCVRVLVEDKHSLTCLETIIAIK